MHLDLYLTFVLATTILMLIPGPNVALIVANSIGWGTRYGLLTVAGASAAMVIQLTITGLGMSALLGSLSHWFQWIRWVGVVYLLYLAVRQWTAQPTDLSAVQPRRRSAPAIFWRGFAVSLTNPKTLFFFGAFFPQFIVPANSAGEQIFLLSITFLLLAVVLDSTWAMLAGRARGLLARNGRWRNRLSGGMLAGAGLGLAVARRR